MAKNISYDEDYKKMIVELYENHTTTATNIVREYGIGSATLYKWIGQQIIKKSKNKKRIK